MGLICGNIYSNVINIRWKGMAGKERKLDLFELMSQAERRNYDYFSQLSDDAKKEFSPWLAMRFMSSSTEHADMSLLFTDVVLNEHFSIVSTDKDFFYRLMCVAGQSTTKRHNMVKPPKAKMKPKIVNELFSELTQEPMTSDEIDMYMRINSLDSTDLAEIAEDFGWDSDKIKALKKVVG